MKQQKGEQRKFWVGLFESVGGLVIVFLVALGVTRLMGPMHRPGQLVSPVAQERPARSIGPTVSARNSEIEGIKRSSARIDEWIQRITAAESVAQSGVSGSCEQIHALAVGLQAYCGQPDDVEIEELNSRIERLRSAISRLLSVLPEKPILKKLLDPNVAAHNDMVRQRGAAREHVRSLDTHSLSLQLLQQRNE